MPFYSTCFYSLFRRSSNRHVYAVSPYCHHTVNHQNTRCWTPVTQVKPGPWRITTTPPPNTSSRSISDTTLSFLSNFARCHAACCVAEPEVVNFLLNRIRMSPFLQRRPCASPCSSMRLHFVTLPSAHFTSLLDLSARSFHYCP